MTAIFRNDTIRADVLMDLRGGQLAFPATQVPSSDPNTQDDYEEGAWTPLLDFGGASTGIAYTANVGFYTKIGNRVHIEGAILLTSKGSASGAAHITGLPFVPGAFFAVSVGRAVNISSVVLNMYDNASTIIELLNAAGAAGVTDASFTNTAIVYFSAHYRV